MPQIQNGRAGDAQRVSRSDANTTFGVRGVIGMAWFADGFHSLRSFIFAAMTLIELDLKASGGFVFVGGETP